MAVAIILGIIVIPILFVVAVDNAEARVEGDIRRANAKDNS